ncbi:hypothetical protein A2U01_0118905, partial [Trifolium medium]|nr:hypothetical protein [Trifolium medium]
MCSPTLCNGGCNRTHVLRSVWGGVCHRETVESSVIGGWKIRRNIMGGGVTSPLVPEIVD